MTTDRQNNPFAFQIGQNSFTMRDLQAPHVRDQDNAAPKPTPPKIFSLDHPKLAPPGMKGISRTLRPGQNHDINVNVNVRMEQPRPAQRPPPPSTRPRLQLGDQDNARREFRSLTHALSSKGISRDR